MGLSEYKEDLFVRYNHFLNKRVTFKQKTAFIRSLLTEFQSMASDIKVVELREKGTKTSLSRNVYVGDVKNADVIIATYFDSPLYHLGPYYILDKEKQQNSTLIFNGLVSGMLLFLGIVFTLLVTNKILPREPQHINWVMLIGGGLIYVLLVYLISIFSKGVGRKRNIVRNNSTIIYLIDKALREKDSSKNIAFAFLDNGVTNERGLYGLQASVKKNSKILYLDSIGSMEKIQYIYEDSGEFSQADTFKKNGIYRIFPAHHEGNSYFLTSKDLNSTSYSEINCDIVDGVVTQLTK